MDAQQRLDAAQTATREGRHAEALAQFLWFHHHALVEMPSMYGVRRSFALSYWKELGDAYPEAIRAMQDVREQSASAVLGGNGGIEAFRDVVAIDSKLNAAARTHQLYVELAVAQPDIAKQCIADAMNAIVEAKDFRLAMELMPDPEARIVRVVDRFNRTMRSLQGRAFTRAPLRWVYVRQGSDDIRQVVTILSGGGRDEEAIRLRALALRQIQSPSARREVDDALNHPHRPPPTNQRELRKLRRLHGK